MIRTKKKSHRTVEVADPDFSGAGVEIECPFFVDLGWGVRWRKDLYADFRCVSKKDGFLVNLRSLLPEPCNVGRLDSIGGRNGALGERRAVREQALEESGDSGLAARVTSGGRWTHDYMSMPIGLEPVREPGELRVSHELAPTREVEAGLRIEIGELNGDGHEVTKSMKAPRKQRIKRFGPSRLAALRGLRYLDAEPTKIHLPNVKGSSSKTIILPGNAFCSGSKKKAAKKKSSLKIFMGELRDRKFAELLI
jgi:hypothetical protein